MDAIQAAVDIAGTLGAIMSNLTGNGFTATFPNDVSVRNFMELVQDTDVNITCLDNRVVVTRS